MNNIELEIDNIKNILIKSHNVSPFYSELINKINLNKGYFRLGNKLNTKQAYLIYSRKYELNKNDINILWSENLLVNILNYTDNELIIYSFVYDGCSFSLFTDFKKEYVLGVIKSNYFDRVKALVLNKIYTDKQLEADYFYIDKGKNV